MDPLGSKIWGPKLLSDGPEITLSFMKVRSSCGVLSVSS